MTTWTLNLDPWHVRFEAEVGLTRTAFQIGRSFVHPRYEDL